MPRTMKERAELARRRQKQRSQERLNKKTKVKLFTIKGEVIDNTKKYLDKKQELIADQWGTCGICGNNLKVRLKHAALDHCHKTGKIRGVLCHACNTALGLLKENIESFEKAIEYIKYFRKRLPWYHTIPIVIETTNGSKFEFTGIRENNNEIKSLDINWIEEPKWWQYIPEIMQFDVDML